MGKKTIIILLVISVIVAAIYLTGKKKGKKAEREKGNVLPDTYEKELQQLSKDSGAPMLNRVDHVSIANAIKSSFGFFNDDENKVYKALNRIPTKSDYYLIVREFGLLNGRDMIDTLYYYFNDSEMSAARNILKKITVTI